ncbi:AAA family ATPase [Campylobacter coli]|nr:AAA family ATPase [Campylobacter coli]EDD2123905.1 AAA family ATPase [Campylobacter coli]EFS5446113.1 AAA family ATPase [Campylobacter coli]ELH4668225.1 AAA family ATPase [Campylobacter coli]
MRPVRIAISGAQCSGKTTLINLMKKHSYFKNFDFIESFSNEIAKTSKKHSENTNLVTQLQMLYHSVNTLKDISTPTIHDRCILDVIVYTGINKDIDLKLFTDSLIKYYKQFDFIFVLDSENIPLESNGIRSIDPEFRSKINNIFKKVDLENVVHLDSKLDPDSRILKIIETLKN